ncbi:uncharacterized protein LOC114075614 isoform X2 [Solanum pennellii]|uniref:Uncharacterized protein LOC114075614 isoform X2 n=1 Tax=Solanum pennellii TaxID=28526 RepID=A0ABM1V282_SOLPN|nr:uncharacterized protein LOC114075614 isoform X2 [Solanum pennellii]
MIECRFFHMLQLYLVTRSSSLDPYHRFNFFGYGDFRASAVLVHPKLHEHFHQVVVQKRFAFQEGSSQRKRDEGISFTKDPQHKRIDDLLITNLLSRHIQRSAHRIKYALLMELSRADQ